MNVGASSLKVSVVWQSGDNHIANNLIHNTPYTGIVVSGRITMARELLDGDGARTCRWHEIGVPEKPYNWDQWYYFEKYFHARRNLVEKNEIHHVMESMGDGNGIYVSGCGKENHIYQNYVHDCTGPHMGGGIRCDDFQNETIVEGNVVHTIHSVQVGISMTGKNHIINNIIANNTARYTAGATEFVVPATLSPEAAECARVAEAAHRALGLRDFSRSDLIVDDQGTVWFLEVNVAPGMTETSLVPLSVEAAGLDLGKVFADLCTRAAERI